MSLFNDAIDGIMGSIKDAFDEESERINHLAKQQEQKLAWNKYWEQYWLIALVAHGAIEENQALLKVQTPSMPKLLMPPNYKVRNFNEFAFVLKRNSNNSPCSNDAVLPQEVEQIITDYLKLCGFANFKVVCTEDTYKYYVSVCALDGFCFGRAMLPNSGDLFRDCETDMLAIEYYDGSGYSLIRANTAFKVYYRGQWVQTSILYSEFGKPYLARFNVHPFNAVGYIARL